MRVVIVGPPAERARLRQALPAAVDVVGEAATVAAAREFDADALLVASNGRLGDAEVSLKANYGERTADRTYGGPPAEALTRREIEVLELLAEGMPNKAIAARLAISDQTVKFHVSSICGKLGAANRTEAVRRAMRRGLITL
jgi:DNA-binding NarL/FixJ family response regulator